MPGRTRASLMYFGAGIGLAILLAWISNQFTSVEGWFQFLIALALAGGVAAALLYLLKRSEGELPPWIIALVAGAALLRLAVGVVWFIALPLVGYDTPMQQVGYVMEDAFRRDTAAWELAASGEPLLSALPAYQQVDQYGGLLFLSALIYRSLGAQAHYPLLIIVFTAMLSATSLAYLWGFSRRVLDEKTAKWAAWGFLLYPEAVLLGSTQMREPFVIVSAAVALYGWARYRHDHRRRWLLWMTLPVLILIPISFTMAAILAFLVGLLSLVAGLQRKGVASPWRHRRAWLWISGVLAAGLVGVWLAWPVIPWDRIAPAMSADRYDNPLKLVLAWITYVSEWQFHLTYAGSGMVQFIIRNTPDWFDMPFLVIYGMLRPFLPAAMAATGIPIWRGIALWRSLGWAIVFIGIVYAPLRAWLFKEEMAHTRRMVLALSLAAWTTILIATFWGGADDWDNPRYRAAFSGIQVVLAAWAYASYMRQRDPLLKKLLAGVGIVFVWVVIWYLSRYVPGIPWNLNLFQTLALAVISAGLYYLWDWAGTRYRQIKAGSPGQDPEETGEQR